jgi:hypothetical protein
MLITGGWFPEHEARKKNEKRTCGTMMYNVFRLTCYAQDVCRENASRALYI